MCTINGPLNNSAASLNLWCTTHHSVDSSEAPKQWFCYQNVKKKVQIASSICFFFSQKKNMRSVSPALLILYLKKQRALILLLMNERIKKERCVVYYNKRNFSIWMLEHEHSVCKKVAMLKMLCKYISKGKIRGGERGEERKCVHLKIAKLIETNDWITLNNVPVKR